MAPSNASEKVKPFVLFKYFTFTSLIVIFIGTIVLSAINTHLARTMLFKKREDFARVLVDNLNQQVFFQFILPMAVKFGEIRLRDEEQYERMDKVVRSTLHSFNVDMVNIYDLNNVVSYSYDPELIGIKDIGGSGFQNAVYGRATSRLVQRGSFWEIWIGYPKEARIVTFAPLNFEKPLSPLAGPVLGVVEIVQDMSDDYKAIYNFQVVVFIMITVVMGILFLVLTFVVRRGEGILQKRAQERLALKEQLSRAKHLSTLGEMVAGVSHEIRNPLGIIRSSSELLKKKMTKLDPTNTIPEVIIEESNRLNNIITDFLNFAKPRNPNLNACRIEDVLDKNLNFLSTESQQKGFTINKQFDAGIPDVLADAEMLYQAFLNVLINAMQAMPAGGKIFVDVFARNSTVTVRFDDEGVGIPEDLLENIWDPFFTTKETGTGLGLGIVKNIIEAHGGRVEVDNRPVMGARVTIELPVEQGAG